MAQRFTLLLPFCLSLVAPALAGSPHPLDPLGREEILSAVEILKASGKLTEASRLPLLALHEPSKDQVLKLPSAPRRQAFAVVYERGRNQTFEAVLDLAERKVVSWKEVPGVQPPMLLEDYELVQQIVRSDPGWQAAMRKRGITDFNRVQIDPWSAGYFGLPEEKGIRVFRGVAHFKGDAVNAYARPIEGVVAYVDLNAKKVFKLVDTGVVPVAKTTADLDPKSVGKLREGPKPLEIRQPAGPSFMIDGHQVHWQKWQFRVALHPREGLVLHSVAYEDEGRLRPLLYRASLSEMVVPYGDPGPAWFFRNAFDEGEYGIGRFANALEPFTDAPANARFVDAVFADEKGGVLAVPRAIAVYERDGGLAWKHRDFDTDRNESRRARDLVVGWIATVGNYEYGFNWIFRQDGSLELEALLTGIMQPKGVALAGPSNGSHEKERYAHLVADGVAAVHHQHFFNFRLDLDVDGATGNSVVELNTEAVPRGPENPYGNAFVMRETMLRTERESQRMLDLATGRKWKVVNPSARNALGQPVGYMLIPGENSLPYAAPDASVRKRAAFVNAHLWATRYEVEERHAAGTYPNQSPGGEGLTRWVAANRPLENQDVVLWYTMGVTHIARPEEWPVMPVHRAGFRLVPASFFSRNPALDLPKLEPARQ